MRRSPAKSCFVYAFFFCFFLVCFLNRERFVNFIFFHATCHLRRKRTLDANYKRKRIHWVEILYYFHDTNCYLFTEAKKLEIPIRTQLAVMTVGGSSITRVGIFYILQEMNKTSFSVNRSFFSTKRTRLSPDGRNCVWNFIMEPYLVHWL